MRHLAEILKIIDGALCNDLKKVSAYTSLLADKLDKDGDQVSSERIKKSLAGSKGYMLHAAYLNQARQIPTDNESKLALGDIERFKRGDINIYLSGTANSKVKDFIKYTCSKDKLLKYGVSFNPALILYGPPGCGKTEIAKYISSQTELPLITARVDSLVSSYLGSTSKNLRNLFDFANNQPCILFLDEFDAIAKVRDDKFELGELKRVVVSLLQNIDRLDNNVIFIAATNHPHLLDPAIWRRFSYKAEVGLPDTNARYEMLQLFLNKTKKDLDLDLIAQSIDGMSGAEIKNFCLSCNQNAALTNNGRVSIDILLNQLANILIDALPLQNQSKEEKLQLLRKRAPKLFTYEKLSNLFDISVGSISKIINKEREEYV